MRFSVPRWRGFHEVYWESLCSRLKLAIGGVIKLEYDAKRGTIAVRHFDTPGHQKKPAKFVAKLIAKICLLVETGKLSTDFTRWRHKAEHASKLGELSPAQVSVFAVVLRKLKIL